MRKLMLVTPARSGTHIILGGLREQHDCILWHPQHHSGDWDTSRERLYLERRDSYEWARTITYNHYYRPHVFGGAYPDNLWTADQQRVSMEHQQERLAQQGPVLLKPSHFKPMVEHWCDYLVFKRQYPSEWPTLYYEDVSVNPDHELGKWQLEHRPKLASVRTPKIPPREAWQNPEEFRHMWPKWIAAEMQNRIGKG